MGIEFKDGVAVGNFTVATRPSTGDPGEIIFVTDQFGSPHGRLQRWANGAWRTILDPDDIPGDFVLSSPAVDQDNYNPNGFAFAIGIRLLPTNSIVITGFSATNAINGTQRVIVNASSDRVIALAHLNEASSPANRLELGGRHMYLFPGDSVRLLYEGAINKWRPISHNGLLNTVSNANYRAMLPGTGTAPNAVGLPHSSNGGTISHPAITDTNYRTRQVRVRGATGTTAGVSSGTRVATGQVNRNLSSLLRVRFGFGAVTANASAFIGWAAAVSALSNQNASANQNIIGVGFDPTQTTLRQMVNATGAATVTDLGLNYPVNTVAWYDLMLYFPPNGFSVTRILSRLDDLTIKPSLADITSNLPGVSTFLAPHVWMNNRTDALDNQIEWSRMELWTF